MRLMSDAEVRDVEAAIARAEAASSGELVVAWLGRSSSYAAVRAWVTTLPMLSVVAVAALVRPPWALGWVALAQYGVAALFWRLSGWGPLLRLLARGQTAAAVQRRAYALFAERGVHQTRDRSGLLIFISELEHRVVILGDRGIHAHLGEHGWQEHVQRLVDGIGAGRFGATLVAEINAFGALLARHFPRRGDDQNELPDAVVREPS